MVIPVIPKSLLILTFCKNVEIPVTYKLLTLSSPTNLVAVTIPVKNALVPVTNPIVLTPVTVRLRVVVTPVTFRLSIVVPPLKDDIPKTSSKTFGWVLPIPIRLLTSSNTKLGAPSTNPALLWNWIFV